MAEYRCDKAMRRSKERCYQPMIFSSERRKWKCTEDCRNCICAIVREDNGIEHHVRFDK